MEETKQEKETEVGVRIPDESALIEVKEQQPPYEV
jgi:hypothetical protein